MVTDKDSENKLAKVRFNCRRGMLELDVMLNHFFDTSYREIDQKAKDLFEDLLESDDQDLFDWLLGAKACPEARFQDMLLVIRHMHAMHQKDSLPA